MDKEGQLVEQSADSKELATKQDQSVSPLVQMLASGNYNLDQIEKMIELQERHDKNVAKKAYSVALSNFRKLAPVLKKDQTVSFPSRGGNVTTYKHTSLGYAMTEVNPLLGECGLNISWHPDMEGTEIVMTTRVEHELGHFEEAKLQGSPDATGSKNPLQAAKSTRSYLKREGAFLLLGLASEDEDDDGGAPEGTKQVEQITAAQADELQSMLLELETLNEGFIGRWKDYYGAWGASDNASGIAVPADQYKAVIAELHTKKQELSASPNADNGK